MISIGIHPNLQNDYSAVQALQDQHNLKRVSGEFMHLLGPVPVAAPTNVLPFRKAAKPIYDPFDGGDAA